jgi:hypothetical protein
VRLAGLTDDPVIREQLLNMSREWMAVALGEKKMPEPKPLAVPQDTTAHARKLLLTASILTGMVHAEA